METMGREAVSICFSPLHPPQVHHVADRSQLEPPKGTPISHLKFWQDGEREGGVKMCVLSLHPTFYVG